MIRESRFHFQLYGPPTGRRWVFLHGLMGYLQNWRTIIRHLESTEHCLAFDQRGHGQSFHPPSGYSPRDYALDLKELTEALGWDKFVLVGHSMGGRNAFEFALRFPEKVSHLVIEDMGPEPTKVNTDYYHRLLDAVPVPFANRDQAKQFFAEDFATIVTAKVKPTEKPEVLAQFLFSNMKENEKGEWIWKFSKAGVLESVEWGHSYQERWGEIVNLRPATLVIRGENSLDLTKDTFARMLSVNSMLKGVEIPEAGHWVHFDQPQAMVSALKNLIT